MRQGVKTALFMGLMAIIGVSSQAQDKVSSQAQDKVSLAYKAKLGQVARYKSEATLSLDAGGMKLNLHIKEVEKVTITAVAPSGDITQESVTESSEMTINGEKAPEENPDKSVTTVVYKSDGTLVSYKSSNDKSDTKQQVRLRNTGNLIFPSRPIGVGDKWSFDVKADPKLGAEDGKADCEVLAAEKINGIDTFKVKMTYKETTFKPALSATNILWVEKSSGDSLQSETEIENIQFGGEKGPLASGKMSSNRIEGSPLGDVKGVQGSTKPDPKPEPKKEKTIDEVVKDYEKLPGLFTLYRKKENGRETVYMEIKESQLDKLLLLEATAATGTAGRVQPSDQISDTLFKFAKGPNDLLLMVTPNTDFRIDPSKPLAKALKRSFPDAYIDSFRIEAQQPDRKSLLINVSDLFRGDIAGVSMIFSGGLFGGSSYGMDREKTYIGAWKNFPDNLVVETNYHFMGSLRSSPGSSPLGGVDSLADPRSIPLKVIYNLFPLPESNYRPRLADPRIGFFTTGYQSFDDDSKSTNKVRYINRWNLEKADPKLDLSPPKKPIVFWLDNAIPLEYRDTVREALQMWNRAFEKVGIKDAIVVKQMPDNADFDPSDMRYNTILWIVSPSAAYARAEIRTNPLTGEILNAKIVVDANFTRGIKMERNILVNPASQFDDPNPIPLLGNKGHVLCEMGEGMMQQAQFGYLALNMIGASVSPISEQEYVKQYLCETVAHEMGHIMGLRHNFIASSFHSADELGNSDLVRKTSVTGSLMDYNAFNIFALKKKDVDYFASTLGPYDYWAIEYGYKSLAANSPDGERDRLQTIAARDNQPGLGYQSDEVADGFDPSVTRFDISKDPLDYWTKNFQVTRYLLFNLDQRVPKHGESYWEFTRTFNGLMNYYATSAVQTTRYIGGLHYNHNHRGDWAEKPTLAPINGDDQRRALKLLNTFIFSEDAFAFPKSYFVKMTDNPNSDMLEALLSGRNSFPIKDQISGIQTGAMKRLFSGAVLSRVSNNEFKVAKASQTLTLPELFNSVHETVWAELKGGRTISELHRQLQRAHIDQMITMTIAPASGTPDDARMLAWNELRQLKSQIAAVKDVSKDTYTHLHLEESLMRISRALNAQQTIGGSSGSRPMTLADLLGGKTQP